MRSHRAPGYQGQERSNTDDTRRSKFVVEFLEEETEEVSGIIGQADTREECEGLLEYEMDCHSSEGQTIVNAEAAEVCAKCDGEGKIPNGNGGQVRCDACGGRVGPISNLRASLRPNETEFLLILRGDFSGQFPPRQAA